MDYDYNNTNITIKTITSLQRDVIFAAEITFICISVYLFGAFSFYLRFRQKKQSSIHNGGRNFLFWFLFVLLFFGVLKFSTVLYSLFEFGEMTSAHCDIIERSYQIITGIALIFLYSFLWLRQYTLYREPSLKSLVSPWLARLSKYFIVVILAVGLSAGVVVGLTGDETHHQFLNQSQLCVFTTVTDPNSISIFACYVVMAAWQVLILFLFVYILCMHQADLACHHVDAPSTYMKLHRLIRNCVIACVITLTTDVITLILDTKLPSSIPQPNFLFMWDINYVINLACVLCCFASWKCMVFPWRRRRNFKAPKLMKITVVAP